MTNCNTGVLLIFTQLFATPDEVLGGLVVGKFGI